VHLIPDNYLTHKNAWRTRHKRFHFQLTPTSSSWLNLVERRFHELINKALRRSSSNSVPELITAIEDYSDAHNMVPEPFVWTRLSEKRWICSRSDTPSCAGREGLMMTETLDLVAT
jgi:DDE superfamily endonuclease